MKTIFNLLIIPLLFCLISSNAKAKSIETIKIIPVFSKESDVMELQTDYAICEIDYLCEVKSMDGQIKQRIYLPASGINTTRISPNGKINSLKKNDESPHHLIIQNRITEDTIAVIDGVRPIWSGNSRFLFYKDQLKNDWFRYDVQLMTTKRIIDWKIITETDLIPNADGSKVIFTVKDLLFGKSQNEINFSDNSHSLIILNIDKNDYVKIDYENKINNPVKHISWSPDGSMFVYCYNFEYKQNESTHWEIRPAKSDIFISNTKGDILAQLTDDPEAIESSTRWISENFIYYWVNEPGWPGGKAYLFELIINE